MNLITRLKPSYSGGLCCVTLVFLSAGTATGQTLDTFVTFEQVYESPDNLDLTLTYARQCAKAGDYLSAMGALEALLFANPNWDSARLFYAYVLFKLDDQNAVKRELAHLELRPLTQKQQNQLSILQKTVKGQASQAKKIKLSGRIELGARYDDNAGNALSETILSNPRQDDISAFLNASAGVRVPVRTKHNGALNISAQYQLLRHETFDNSDYDVFKIIGGYGQNLFGAFASLNVDYNTVKIDGTAYLEETGPRVKLSKAVSEKTQLNLTGAMHYQAYKDLPNAIGESFRSGQNYTIGLGVTQRLKARQSVKALIRYNSKDAKAPRLRYNGLSVGTQFKHEFKDDAYVVATAHFRKLNFLNPVATPSPPVKRNDNHKFLKLSYGVPLNVLAEKISVPLQDSYENFLLEGGVTFEDRNSNISGFDYRNFGSQVKLVWKF